MRCRVHLAVSLTLLLAISGSCLATAAAAAGAPGSSSAPRLAAATAVVAAGAPGSSGAPAAVAPLLPCLEEVLPCTAYLKLGRHPSQTCCTALQRAVAVEMPCLCRLFADQDLLHTFNVTRNQLFHLPARCGLPVGCRANSSGGTEPVVEAPPPPAVMPGKHGGDSSTADRRSSSVGHVVATVVLGGMASIVAPF